MERIEIRWAGGMLFHGKSPSGHDVLIDASPKVGGKDLAPRPMELFAFGIAGCTAMDVVAILRKMKLLDRVKDFRVVIEYERKEDHPRVYKWVKVRYLVKGDLPKEKVEKAASLSQEKYCSASAMVKEAVEDFSYEVEVV